MERNVIPIGEVGVPVTLTPNTFAMLSGWVSTGECPGGKMTDEKHTTVLRWAFGRALYFGQEKIRLGRELEVTLSLRDIRTLGTMVNLSRKKFEEPASRYPGFISEAIDGLDAALAKLRVSHDTLSQQLSEFVPEA